MNICYNIGEIFVQRDSQTATSRFFAPFSAFTNVLKASDDGNMIKNINMERGDDSNHDGGFKGGKKEFNS
jgi:hypothetical protein